MTGTPSGPKTVVALSVIPRGRLKNRLRFTVHARFFPHIEPWREWPTNLDLAKNAAAALRRLQLGKTTRDETGKTQRVEWHDFEATLETSVDRQLWDQTMASAPFSTPVVGAALGFVLGAEPVSQPSPRVEVLVPVNFLSLGEHRAHQELTLGEDEALRLLLNTNRSPRPEMTGRVIGGQSASYVDTSVVEGSHPPPSSRGKHGPVHVPSPETQSAPQRLTTNLMATHCNNEGQPTKPEPQTVDGVLAVLSASPTLARELGLIFDVFIAVEAESIDATRVRFSEDWAGVLAPGKKTVRMATEMRLVPGLGYFADRFSVEDYQEAVAQTRVLAQVGKLPPEKSFPLPAKYGDRESMVRAYQWAPSVFSQHDTVGALGDWTAHATWDPVRRAAKQGFGDEKDPSTLLTAEETVGFFGMKEGWEDVLTYQSSRHQIFDQEIQNTGILPEAAARLDVLDLIKGYRPYVRVGRDEKAFGRWFSLCGSSKTIWNAKSQKSWRTVCDDGLTELGVLSGSNDKNGFISDIFFVWRNWPLCVPPAFSQPDDCGELHTGGISLKHELSQSYLVPPLRFGLQYEFTVLPISIAGEPFGDTPSRHTPGAGRTQFRRREPALPPDVLGYRPRYTSGADPVTPSNAKHDPARTFSNHDVIAIDACSREDWRRWLVAPAVSPTLFEFSRGLDEGEKGFKSDALETLRDTDEDPLLAAVDLAKNRLTDPAVRGVRIDVDGQTQFVDFPTDRARAVLLEVTTDRSLHLQKEYSSRDAHGAPTLYVYVPEGEAIKIELRSFLYDDPHALFCLTCDYRAKHAEAGGAPGDDRCDRKYPLNCVQPPKALTLLRPVEAPVKPPLITDVHTSQQLGKARVGLDVGVDAHVPSTERLELRGTWVELRDTDQGVVQVERTGSFGSVIVPRDQYPANLLRPASNHFEHTFEDGRYRELHLTVVGRAPQRYAKELGKDSPGERSSPSYIHRVLNSVRPQPIEVDEVVPITRSYFSKGRRVRDQRWGFRIYMKPGFMQSGPSEMVAVLSPARLSKGASARSSGRLVSQFAADPLAGPVVGDKPPRVLYLGSRRKHPKHRRKRGKRGANESLLNSVVVPLPEEGGRLTQLTLHEPQRTASGRWYVDVAVDNGDLYFPFARLSLARYQPNSILGAELSPPSLLELMQVPAKRRIVRSGFGSDVSFRVHGTWREDTKLTATVFVHAGGVGDEASKPTHGELMLDEDGLWKRFAQGDRSVRYDFERCGADMISKVPIVVPYIPDGPVPKKRWRVVIEETETYRHRDGHDTTRVVWFATYDSETGFVA